MVRLRDQWVLVDPQEVRRARAQQDRKVTPVEALSAADGLHGGRRPQGRRTADGVAGYAAAAARNPGGTGAGRAAPPSPTLRDYQVRGLNWLARMTSLDWVAVWPTTWAWARRSR